MHARAGWYTSKRKVSEEAVVVVVRGKEKSTRIPDQRLIEFIISLYHVGSYTYNNNTYSMRVAYCSKYEVYCVCLCACVRTE